ncbi:MAG TPA: phospho-N-acetylmuramoyl-pentapeptide-transferase [Thermoanaerobaculaceae bacterium]|nr:phospho-N-acetylmuramoyl-pentapeptide-transferase [Holophagae bacterium]HPW55938.1 phospho-N-acetylmuramoyl-pentapeptide-transferase [Thermoanaerobaculaceae bacterium]
MLELVLTLLRLAGIEHGYFRLAEFLTFRIIMAAITSLTLSLTLGHRVIVWLYRQRFRDAGGEFRSIDTHSKRGTPTGGGILILLAVVTAVALWGRLDNAYLLAVSAAFVYFGLVGWFDDAQKVRFKSALFGLGQMAKTVLQLGFIVPFGFWLVSDLSPLPSAMRSQLLVPFVKTPLGDPGRMVFAVFAMLVFFSVVNAVNITDGLDGLVTGPAVTTALLYGAFAYVLGNAVLSHYLLFAMLPGAGEMAVFAAALAGGLLGFLWFNAYPAEVFMGDTGSLAIGGGLASMALLTRQEMLFPIVGGIFVANIAASLVQEKIGMRIGRRLVLRAPLHHGQTERGIAEPKVVIRFWIIAFFLMLIAGLSLKLR